MKHYKQLLGGSNYNVTKNYAFDNLIKVMMNGLPSTDWIPPLLAYYEKFNEKNLLEFLKKLNCKFAGDWLSQKTPTDRIEAMNNIIKIIDKAKSINNVLTSDAFDFDCDNVTRSIQDDVYGRGFTLFVMLILDYIFQNQDQKMHFETLSVEHILPQNPATDSQWIKDFNNTERMKWTDKLGNLVLITRRKNTSQGRLDYTLKKTKYFQKSIDTCPNSLRVFSNYRTWTPIKVQKTMILCLVILKVF